MPVVLRLVVLLVVSLAVACSARAGAFMVPDGAGQFIAGVGYSEATRRFDQSGQAVPTQSFRKLEASGFLEYGLTPWLTLVAAPTLSHEHDPAALNSVTGSDSSAFGARLRLFAAPGQVLAVQALVQPPLGDQGWQVQLADGGAHALSTDIRLLYGRDFTLFGLPAFVDIEPGGRLRAEPFPDEGRLDSTLGVHLTPKLTALLQEFACLAPATADPPIERLAYVKAQGSLVYDISHVWSVQLGAFRTIAGRDIVRETGPLAGLWYRF